MFYKNVKFFVLWWSLQCISGGIDCVLVGLFLILDCLIAVEDARLWGGFLNSSSALKLFKNVFGCLVCVVLGEPRKAVGWSFCVCCFLSIFCVTVLFLFVISRGFLQ